MSERGLVEIFDGTEEVCFVFTEISLFYLRYLIVILDHLSMNNITTHLILIKGISPVYPNFYSKFYWNKKTMDAEKFLNSKKELYNLNVRVISKFDKRKSQKAAKHKNEVTASCENAIRSYLSTHKLKTEDIEQQLKKIRIKKLWAKQEKNYFDVFNFLDNDSYLTQFKGKIIFLNGRLPDQSAIKSFCRVNNKSFLSLEGGMPANKRMHLSTNQTAVISEFSQELAYQITRLSVPHHEQIEYAEVFLQKNMTDKTFNHHLSLEKEELQDHFSKQDSVKVVTIFTSTIGEFIANNGIESYGWDTQYDALDSTVKYLLERNYDVSIRMHPNSARFSWRDIKRIYHLGLDSQVKVYLPWEEVNSYNLVSRSEFVFTWGSTIGLEASALGKKTYIFSPTYYSLIADVRVFSPHSLLKLDLDNWTSDSNLAKQAIYISNNHGVSIHDDTFTDGTKLILKELEVLNASYNRKVRQVMKKSYLLSAKNVSNSLKVLRIPTRIVNQILVFILKVYR